MAIYRRVLQYYRPFFGQTILGLALSLVGIGLNLLKPWPFKIIVDQVLPTFAGSKRASNPEIFHLLGKDLPSSAFSVAGWVALLCLVLVVIHIVWACFTWITNFVFVKIGLEALLKVRTDIYSHLQRLSLKFHDARRSSDSTFRVAYDSQAIQTIYNKGFTGVFGSVITLGG